MVRQKQITIQRSKRHDLGPLKKGTLRNMQRLFKDAVGVFLMTAANRVAVDSGMTSHSFIEAGREVGKVTILRAIIDGGIFADRIYESTLFPGVMDKKSARHGELLGKKAYTIDLGTVQSPIMFFKFEIVVLQHFLHEDDWRSLEQAQEAMHEYIRANASDYMPSISDWLASGKLISRK